VIWSLFALLLALAPLVFTSGLSITMLSQMGIAIIACLSYNMLLGPGRHAEFRPRGVHRAWARSWPSTRSTRRPGSLPIPVSLVPLVGGLAGMGFAALLGYVTTRKSGTTFAMITLGMGELVFAMSLMIPEFFGGEGGINANRVVGKPFMGISFGPPIQVYYLIAVYTFVCGGGHVCLHPHAAGAHAERGARQPGARGVHRLQHPEGALPGLHHRGLLRRHLRRPGALNFEIVTAEVVGAARSGGYLLFTFLGGATFFFGPIIGAILMVLAFMLFSEFTSAWLLYLGLIFLFMVMYAPGGIASLIMMNLRVAAFGKLRQLWPCYLAWRSRPGGADRRRRA
jgi:branched-chain amino acid transport system permease protein